MSHSSARRHMPNRGEFYGTEMSDMTDDSAGESPQEYPAWQPDEGPPEGSTFYEGYLHTSQRGLKRLQRFAELYPGMEEQVAKAEERIAKVENEIRMEKEVEKLSKILNNYVAYRAELATMPESPANDLEITRMDQFVETIQNEIRKNESEMGHVFYDARIPRPLRPSGTTSSRKQPSRSMGVSTARRPTRDARTGRWVSRRP